MNIVIKNKLINRILREDIISTFLQYLKIRLAIIILVWGSTRIIQPAALKAGQIRSCLGNCLHS